MENLPLNWGLQKPYGIGVNFRKMLLTKIHLAFVSLRICIASVIDLNMWSEFKHCI